MPNIPTYASPAAERGLQPSDLGVSAYEQQGRHIGATFHLLGSTVGNDIDIYEQHAGQQEVSAITRQSAEALQAGTVSWNQTANGADPNATDTGDKWRSSYLDPMLDKIGADATTPAGQRAAEEARNRLREHFTTTVIGDQSAMAAAAIHSNLTAATNAVSQAAEADPSTFESGLSLLSGMVDAQIGAHSGNLDPSTAASIREGLAGPIAKTVATSAFYGLAQKNSGAAIAALDSGVFGKYFNGDEVHTLREFARSQGNINDEVARKQNKDAAAADLTKIQSSLAVDPEGNITVPKDFLGQVMSWSSKYGALPGGEAVPGTARALVDFAATLTKRAAEGQPFATDPGTYNDFKARATLPPGDPHALTQAEVIRAAADRKLNDHDYNFFKGAIARTAKDPAYKGAYTRFMQVVRGLRSSITGSDPLLGHNDPIGDQKYTQFQQAADDAFERAYEAGNWRDLLDRNKPDSLFYMSSPYMRKKGEGQDDLLNTLQGGSGLAPAVKPTAAPAVKWKQGQSMDDLFKSLGGH